MRNTTLGVCKHTLTGKQLHGNICVGDSQKCFVTEEVGRKHLSQEKKNAILA